MSALPSKSGNERWCVLCRDTNSMRPLIMILTAANDHAAKALVNQSACQVLSVEPLEPSGWQLVLSGAYEILAQSPRRSIYCPRGYDQVGPWVLGNHSDSSDLIIAFAGMQIDAIKMSERQLPSFTACRPLDFEQLDALLGLPGESNSVESKPRPKCRGWQLLVQILMIPLLMLGVLLRWIKHLLSEPAPTETQAKEARRRELWNRNALPWRQPHHLNTKPRKLLPPRSPAKRK